MPKKYLPRICDNVLARKLEAKGAVLVEGAKWCGKTTTALQQARSVLYMEQPENRSQYLLMAEIRPTELLKGDTPRLIDEWQIAPKLWDAVRFEVDQRDEFAQFILTGSYVPTKIREQISHTGTGRISRMKMRPMSLFESGDSTGEVSISSLFAGEEPFASLRECPVEKIAFLTCRGGWPKAVGQSERVALQQAFDYLDAVVETDISSVDGVRRDHNKARTLMRSYARFTSQQATVVNIEKDMRESDTMSDATVRSYLDALSKLFVIEDLSAWNPNLRSKTAIRTSPTRHFVDPSIATAALGLGPADLINDLNTFGLIFESLCIRDLRVYADALDGQIYHYCDKNGLECDAVIHLRNGSYGLIEIKLGGEDHIDKGAASLLDLKNKIDPKKMKLPSFCMVLVGTGQFSYTRPDGVLVVPITMLGV